MAEVKADATRLRRSKLSADLDDAERRIRYYEELALEEPLSMESEAALKQAMDDAAAVRKATQKEYEGDPAQVLDEGDRAIPDNPLNAPTPKATTKA